jgi:tRNA A64-2'-O-ribosylphosphate transferase
MSSFPRTLADLKAGDNTLFSPQSFYGSLKELRKSTLSIPNRLRSILRDANFAQQVAAEYHLPLIANERCGSWYIPPDKKMGRAYFKSTDGHAGQWSFSLRRLNLQLLEVVGKHGGCVIVDSTRRGKLMPDAFSKTVPIWCAVINRALFPEQEQLHHFQRPAIGLPESEIAQINGRLEAFVGAFQNLGLGQKLLRQKLGRPMRLQWVIDHSTEELSKEPDGLRLEPELFHTIILCSASKRVEGAEMSEGGYIQGAGDDSEGWSQGLTPQVFWKHKEKLLRGSEDELPELIKMLLSEERQLRRNQTATLIRPTSNIHIGASTGKLDSPDYDLVINCHGPEPDPDTADVAKQLSLRCAPGKLGSRELRCKLHMVKSCVAGNLERNLASQILITCETGKDLSVGVALLLLCLFYSDDGECSYNSHRGDISAENDMMSNCGCVQEPKVDKTFIRKRLAWISSSKEDVNPSRSTLQSVHAYLMERP